MPAELKPDPFKQPRPTRLEWACMIAGTAAAAGVWVFVKAKDPSAVDAARDSAVAEACNEYGREHKVKVEMIGGGCYERHSLIVWPATKGEVR